ncbi:MAG: di-heme oxidoredictase family protein [Hyphomicrobiales bacterium]
MRARLLIVLALASAATLAARAEELDSAVGKALFDRQWVQAPASTNASDGLGPLFNAKACNSCHKDGGPARLIVLDGEAIMRGLVVRVGSVTGAPDPFYGHQLQDRAVSGLMPEAKIDARLVKVASGTGATDTDVAFDFTLNGPAFADDTLSEVRIAPSLAGRGLLQDVSQDAVLALADPDDRNGDGISGRARIITGADGIERLGRFGAKATATSLREQTANAAGLDIGLSSPLQQTAYGDCTPAQKDCLAMATGNSAAFENEEISGDMIAMIAAYVATLPRPAVKSDSQAESLFTSTGCSSCHMPQLPNAAGKPLAVFTDLLLHDMGPALSGKIGDHFASPSEWRTAPLIDLNPLHGKRRYLHDGRAATIDAAIRWHGGEADPARARFEALNAADRSALIRYLEAL